MLAQNQADVAEATEMPQSVGDPVAQSLGSRVTGPSNQTESHYE
jgi:hypothetical protein